ncbi:BppU family phage baseplate upper protein, partial [Bacillus velezensis]
NKQSMSVHKFSFTIDQALIDSDIIPVAEYYISDFESLKQKINELYDETIKTVEELREKFADLENVETKQGAQEKADKALADSRAYTNGHATRTDNPHSVTKGQIGLNNVDNVKQAPLDQFQAHAADGTRHISKVERDKWNGGQLFSLTDSDGSSKTITETNLDDIKMSGMYYISMQHTKNKPANYGQLIVVQRTRGTSPTFVQVFIDTVGEGTPTYVRSFSTEGVWSKWSQIETVTGAQAKVDAHANKKDIHVTQSDKNKWNAGQIAKLTKDDGKRTQLANETDILALSSGFYYASGTSVKNNPVANDSSWF